MLGPLGFGLVLDLVFGLGLDLGLGLDREITLVGPNICTSVKNCSNLSVQLH